MPTNIQFLCGENLNDHNSGEDKCRRICNMLNQSVSYIEKEGEDIYNMVQNEIYLHSLSSPGSGKVMYNRSKEQAKLLRDVISALKEEEICTCR